MKILLDVTIQKENTHTHAHTQTAATVGHVKEKEIIVLERDEKESTFTVWTKEK